MKCAAHQISFCSICSRRRASIGSADELTIGSKPRGNGLNQGRKLPHTLDHIEMTPESAARWRQHNHQWKVEKQRSKDPMSVRLLEDFAGLPKCFVPPQVKEDASTQIKLARKHVEYIRMARELMAGGGVPQGVDSIRSLLISMFRESIELLGAPPSPYYILGAGSFGRTEMMPFSDCDLCIIYDDKKPGAKAYTGDLLGLLIFKAKMAVFLMNPSCTEIPEGFSVDQEFEGSPEKVAMQCVMMQMTLCDVSLVVFDDSLHTRFEQALTEALRENKDALMEVVGEVLQQSQTYLKRSPSGTIDLKNELYRPLQKFVSLLAALFDKQLRKHKNSLARLEALGAESLIDPALGELVSKALEYVLAVRLDRHSKKGRADDAIPVGELDKKQLALVLEALKQIHLRLQEYRKSRDASVFGPAKKKGFWSF